MVTEEMRALMGRLGYTFKDELLLLKALTHTSYANEHRKMKTGHNERLEFLGDAVLEAVSSEYLYGRYPTRGEGDLSRRRAEMVCESSLAIAARKLDIPPMLRLGHGEEAMGGRGKDSIISDAVEAIIGAIYLDGGFSFAREFILTHILRVLENETLYSDVKTELQELLQTKTENVTYELQGEIGPEHEKVFRMAAVFKGEVIGIGEGRTKKAASQAAARDALARINGEQNVSETD